MGEYALYNGESVKIGTCENMYYLRADQRDLVEAQKGNVDPIKDAGEIRFRFPWPDEDDVDPGAFDDYERKAWLAVAIHCEGNEVQRGRMRSDAPDGGTAIVQQKLLDGKLMLVYECRCGERFRLPTLEDAHPIVDACADPARRSNAARGLSVTEMDTWWDKVALRIISGYEEPARKFTKVVMSRAQLLDRQARELREQLRKLDAERASILALDPDVLTRLDEILASETTPASDAVVNRALAAIEQQTVAPKVAARGPTIKDGTFRRDRLFRLLVAGKLDLVESYSYDDMTGSDRNKNARPCALAPKDERDETGRVVKWGERKEGVAYLRADEFEGKPGRAYARGGLITLHVHSNCNYTFRIKS